jgi:hypothetical protein
MGQMGQMGQMEVTRIMTQPAMVIINKEITDLIFIWETRMRIFFVKLGNKSQQILIEKNRR